MTSIQNYSKEESFNSETFSEEVVKKSKEESFNSETFSEEVVKKVKKTKSTATKTIKTKTVKTFDQEEELMLMESSKEVITSSVEPLKLEQTECEEKKEFESTENGDNNIQKPLRKRSEGGLKKKGKKTRKSDSGKENHISVKSSFSKFDALQKKENKSFTKLDNGTNKSSGTVNLPPPVEKNCNSCGKLVFQMEQMKAEKKIWHKSCFRCKECNKQLSVDSYQSHEGILYCKPHFKTLFAPKVVEDNEPQKPRKAEPTIRENQPDELPKDVIRASDKADLGLDEIHQLNIKSAFQLFEHHAETTKESTVVSSSRGRKSNSFISKIRQKKGDEEGSIYSSEEDYDSDNDLNEGDEDFELMRAKRALREPQLHCANMDDIKTKFESGHTMSKEERREERKQEIQNIRSRLFMGKQARIKEMYQQAVAESEQTIVASSKKVDMEVSDKARSIKERFEKGEVGNDENPYPKNDEDMSVFEKGSTKKSRSLFLEMERNEQDTDGRYETVNRRGSRKLIKTINNEEGEIEDENSESVDIAAKFRFFESYKKNEQEKKIFRITPPRDGVVKLPSPDKDFDENQFSRIRDKNELEKSHTASKMLSLFRQMEEKRDDDDKGPKPLKRFTPPPDGRYYEDGSESEYSEYDDESDYSEEEEEEYEEVEQVKYKYEDECIKAAISEERAKKLRDKFEKWEKDEINREQNNSSVNLYEGENDESQIESAKSLRQKFESMKYVTETTKEQQPRIKVNRFV